MKMNPPSNLVITNNFGLSFAAAEEPNIEIANRHQVTLLDVTNASDFQQLFSVSTTATEFDLRKIPTAAKMEPVEYKPGMIYRLVVIGFANKRRSDPAQITFGINAQGEVEQGAVVAPSTAEAELAPVAPTVPAKAIAEEKPLRLAPDCNLVGRKLSITPKADESSYTLFVVKVSGGKNESMAGRADIPGMPPGAWFQIDDVFKNVVWAAGHPQNGRYALHLYALDAENVQSKPAEFPEEEYNFDGETSEPAISAKPDEAPPVVKPTAPTASDTLPKELATIPVTLPTAPEKVQLDAVPDRLARIRNDLKNLSSLPGGKRNRLWRMSCAINDIRALLRSMASQLPEQVAALMHETDELLQKISIARIVQSQEWAILTGRLGEIMGICLKIGDGAGQPGEKIVAEAKTLRQILESEKLDFKDVEAAMPVSKELLAQARAAKATWDAQEKQREEEAKARPVPTSLPASALSPAPSSVPDLTPATEVAPAAIKPAKPAEPAKVLLIAPKEALEQIWTWLDSAKKAIHGARADAVTLATMRIEDTRAALERLRDKYPDTEAKKILGIEEEIANLESSIEQILTNQQTAKRAEEAREAEEKARKEKEASGKREENKGHWYKRALKAVGNGLRKRWPLLVLLVIATVLGIWAYRNRDNIAKGFDLMRTKVFTKGATGPSKPAGTDRGQPIDKTDNSETTKSQQQVLPALAGMSNLPPAMMVDANSANNISVGMTNVVFGGSNNTTYVGSQVLINNSSNVFIYNGLGHSTPANRADNARPIQIPGPCTGTKGVQGYHWTTNLVAGQCLPYIYDRSQWKMRVVKTFTEPDLKTELLGLDGNWHVVPPSSTGTNSIIATGARYTVRPDATDTVQLEFWLIPRN